MGRYEIRKAVEALCQAVVSGNKDVLPSLCERINLNVPIGEAFEEAPLQLEGLKKDLNLDKGFNLRQATPLALAIVAGDVETVELLLRLGSDPLAQGGVAITQLFHREIPDRAEKLSVILRVAGAPSLLQRITSGIPYLEKDKKTWNVFLDYIEGLYGARAGEAPELRELIRKLTQSHFHNPHLFEFLLERGYSKAIKEETRYTSLCVLAKFGAYAESKEKVESVKRSFKKLIEEGEDINETDILGRTPLHILLSSNPRAKSKLLLEMTTFLLDIGSDPNRQASDMETPLLSYLRELEGERRRPDINILKALVSRGGDPNIPDVHGIIPLEVCLEIEKAVGVGLEVFETLLEYGANPKAKTSLLEPLLVASVSTPAKGDFKKSLYLAKMFLEWGADPLEQAQIGSGFNFLTALARRVISRLELNDEKNFDDVKDLLHEVIERAISLGASLNAPDGRGNYPIHFGIANLHFARLLMEMGAKLDVQNPFSGETPAHIAAIWFAQISRPEKLTELQKLGIDLYTKDFSGTTPLSALFYENPEVVTPQFLQLLVSHGLDLTRLESEEGGTLLHVLAVAWKKRSDAFQHIEKVLLVAEQLVSFGIDVNARDKEGKTFLHELATIGNKTLIEGAVRLGSRTSVVDILGESPGDVFFSQAYPASKVTSFFTWEPEKRKADIMWAVGIGLFPTKNADLFIEMLEHGGSFAEERAKEFLFTIIEEHPISVATELVPKLSSASGAARRVIQEVLSQVRATPNSLNIES